MANKQLKQLQGMENRTARQDARLKYLKGQSQKQEQRAAAMPPPPSVNNTPPPNAPPWGAAKIPGTYPGMGVDWRGGIDPNRLPPSANDTGMQMPAEQAGQAAQSLVQPPRQQITTPGYQPEYSYGAGFNRSGLGNWPRPTPATPTPQGTAAQQDLLKKYAQRGIDRYRNG